VIGDLCPRPQTLRLLRRFFDACPQTQLHLYFEAKSLQRADARRHTRRCQHNRELVVHALVG